MPPLRVFVAPDCLLLKLAGRSPQQGRRERIREHGTEPCSIAFQARRVPSFLERFERRFFAGLRSDDLCASAEKQTPRTANDSDRKLSMRVAK